MTTQKSPVPAGRNQRGSNGPQLVPFRRKKTNSTAGLYKTNHCKHILPTEVRLKKLDHSKELRLAAGQRFQSRRYKKLSLARIRAVCSSRFKSPWPEQFLLYGWRVFRGIPDQVRQQWLHNHCPIRWQLPPKANVREDTLNIRFRGERRGSYILSSQLTGSLSSSSRLYLKNPHLQLSLKISPLLLLSFQPNVQNMRAQSNVKDHMVRLLNSSLVLSFWF